MSKEVNCVVTDGNQTYYGDHFVVHTNTKLLCYTPETSIMLYTNFTLIKILIEFSDYPMASRTLGAPQMSAHFST